MKDTILICLGVVAMLFLGYITAVRGAQDLVWLLVPGLALVIAILSITRILR
jgi:hypothetical protein